MTDNPGEYAASIDPQDVGETAVNRRIRRGHRRGPIDRDPVTLADTTAALQARVEAARAAATNDGDPAPVGLENTPQAYGEARTQVVRSAWETSIAAADHADLTMWRLPDLAKNQHGMRLAAFADSLVGDRKVRNLVLAGPSGTGKTSAAVAVGWAALESGLTVRFIDHAKYLLWLQPDAMPAPPHPYAAWSPGQLRVRVRHCDVLVLDDLGYGQAADQAVSEHVARETQALVGDRADTPGRVTVTTTNLPAAALAVMYGERFMSRLSKQALAVKFTGADRRGRRLDF